jgi:hypothetical protein
LNARSRAGRDAGPSAQAAGIRKVPRHKVAVGGHWLPASLMLTFPPVIAVLSGHTGLSAQSPAPRAEAQRLCALAQTLWRVAANALHPRPYPRFLRRAVATLSLGFRKPRSAQLGLIRRHAGAAHQRTHRAAQIVDHPVSSPTRHWQGHGSGPSRLMDRPSSLRVA